MKKMLLPLFSFLFFQSNAQVPEAPQSSQLYEGTIEMRESGKPQNRISYFMENGKYGFVIDGKKQAAIYDKINSSIAGYIVIKNKRYGIVNKEGMPVTKIIYDSIGGFRAEKKFLVKLNAKYGLFTENGKPILPIKYDKIHSGNRFLSIVEQNNKGIRIISNETKKPVVQNVTFIDIYANLAIVKSNGKFGVVKSKTIIPFEYDSIFYQFNTGRNSGNTKSQYIFINAGRTISDVILKKGENLGLATAEGAIIYTPTLSQIVRESMKGYYTVKKDQLFGIYFVSAKKKSDIAFDKVYSDGVGYVMAVKNKKAGVFNMKGDLIVPFEYDDDFIAQYSGIGLRVRKNNKRGIVDPKGNILVPTIYDDVSTFYESGFGKFIKVELENKTGVVGLDGKIIIPVVYDWVGEENGFFKVVTPGPDRKFGLFTKEGKTVVPAEYAWITDTDTEHSKISVLKKSEHDYNFLNRKGELILPENIASYGYILDEHLLLNPFHINGKKLLAVRSKKGKTGLINEVDETLGVPMIYDTILQRFEGSNHTYFSARKGGKFGLINELNQEIIPFEYDTISLDFVSTNSDLKDFTIVLSKKGKYGTVNQRNETVIPFQYKELQRISPFGLFKAKTGEKYSVIDEKGKAITESTFDEVAYFETIRDRWGDVVDYQTLTFNGGKMRVMNHKGEFFGIEMRMQPHYGYKTFDELKFALVEAMNSETDVLLKEFAQKIAPSEHIFFYLKNNIFDSKTLYSTDPVSISNQYFNELRIFKYEEWHVDTSYGYRGYNRGALTEVTDYGIHTKGMVTNIRNEEWDFGSIRVMERFLRNAVKVNGYWISSYFMKRNF